MRGRSKNCERWQEITPISTSGFAAHTTPELALERAIFEVVERDAFFLCWYGNIAAQAIPLGADMVGEYFSDLAEEQLAS